MTGNNAMGIHSGPLVAWGVMSMLAMGCYESESVEATGMAMNAQVHESSSAGSISSTAEASGLGATTDAHAGTGGPQSTQTESVSSDSTSMVDTTHETSVTDVTGTDDDDSGTVSTADTGTEDQSTGDTTDGECVPDCGTRICGLDPVCGEPCGTCEAGHLCHQGLCLCEPNCEGRECGDDPVCGKSCGHCGPGDACHDGLCVCEPVCGNRECGADPVCGESCGNCGPDEVCHDGDCRCQPSCGDQECGRDPVCHTSCGNCPGGHSCVDGTCKEDDCEPNCSGRECGPDPKCHQQCGVCGTGENCDESTGQCECVPQCGARECGADPVCGETCGSCESGETCDDGTCVPMDPVWPWMVRIPKGSFTMGCNEAERCLPGEVPVHDVNLGTFDIDKTEVSAEAYEACVDAGACMKPTTDLGCTYFVGGRHAHPINCVTWNDADTYCRWAGKRLPTEAEWEKAARGQDLRPYPWGDMPEPSCEITQMRNQEGFGGCGNEMTTERGFHADGRSPYGAVDMAGNVSEWVADWYRADYYSVSPSNDPLGPASGTDGHRVARGGGLFDFADGLTTFTRAHGSPHGRSIDRGFRCVRVPNFD